MSISGLFLIVFLLLHVSINLFSVIDLFTGSYGSPDGLFKAGCDFMSLPIVTVMVPVLALGFFIHIFYGCYLTWTNLRSRGGYCRYAVSSKAKTDSWASRNMIVLGIIILGFIAFHLTHFCSRSSQVRKCLILTLCSTGLSEYGGLQSSIWCGSVQSGSTSPTVSGAHSRPSA